jgi:exopolysaccharide production protein ExoZ
MICAHPVKEKHVYASVQALRGVWALVVVTFHAVIMLRDRLGFDVGMFGGAGGVDLFFVISGFTMILTTQKLWGQQYVSWSYLRRRLIRIVPLYWIVTTVKLCILVAGGNAIFTSWHSIASYLFIPARNSLYEIFPVMTPGWTLYFEMFFYSLIALCLYLRKAPLVPVTILFGGLAIVGFVLRPFELAILRVIDPQLLEFVFGMWIGKWVIAGKKLSRPVAGFVLLSCIGMIAVTNTLPLFITDQYRFIIWGIPSAFLLYAALSLDSLPLWKARPLQVIGGASFAIYLTHDFAISIVRVFLQQLHVHGALAIVWVMPLVLGVATIIGIYVNRKVEKPMITWLRSKLTMPFAPRIA